MLLPSGQVLFGVGGKDIQCYTPHGKPHDAWRPTIHAIASLGGSHYRLKGTQLNGLSQANIYGDDCYPATNYPLIRLQNDATHKVYYCRTYDFSSMGVATGSSMESVRFTVPNVPSGSYDLCVVANGISSHCVDFLPHRKKRHEHEEDREGGGRRRTCCECCCEPCRCDEDGAHGGEIRELKEEMRRLQNGLHRLSLMAQRKDVYEKKEVTKEQEHRKEEHGEDEDDRKRRDKSI